MGHPAGVPQPWDSGAGDSVCYGCCRHKLRATLPDAACGFFFTLFLVTRPARGRREQGGAAEELLSFGYVVVIHRQSSPSVAQTGAG